jgi:hypothetical protein
MIFEIALGDKPRVERKVGKVQAAGANYLNSGMRPADIV